MIHKRLKVLLLSAAFLSLPAVKAYDWKATGDHVGADGFAYDANNEYQEGDRIITSSDVIEDPSGETGANTTMRKIGRLRSKSFKKGRRVFSPVGFTRGESGGGTGSGDNTSFESTVADSVLNIYGTLNGKANGDACALKVDGDIILKATHADMTVNIMSDVSFIPYIDPTGDAQGQGGSYTGAGYAQIHCDVEAGKKIEFNIDHNVEFMGRTLAGTNTTYEPMDMFVSFRGRGEVFFNMANGTSIKFSGDVDDTFAVDMLHRTDSDLSIDGVSNNAAGTKVLICMDQTQDDVNKGLNKVTFRRKAFDAEDQRLMVYVGPNSGFSYVSDDVTGKAYQTDASYGDFGSVAFDVSNQGTGRMVLFLQGARKFGWEMTDKHGNALYTPSDPEYYKVAERYLFNDASFVVAGVKVNSFLAADLRKTLNYSIPAGGQAIMRVIDELAYDARSGSYAPSVSDTRGLLLVNDTETVAKLASDNYWDFWNGDVPSGENTVMRSVQQKLFKNRARRFSRANEEQAGVTVFGHEWSYSFGIADAVNLRNTRPGFVLGVNGMMDVYDHTFLDYVVGTVNRPDDLALNDYQDYNDPAKSRAIVANHNPAGFVMDGLDEKLFTQHLSLFEAANPAVSLHPVQAEVNLRGNGAVFMRACANQSLGYIESLWQLAIPGNSGTKMFRKAFGKSKLPSKFYRQLRATSEDGGSTVVNPLDVPTLNWDEILVVGQSKYNGYNLNIIPDVTSIDGQNVLEVQGPVSIDGLANNSVIDSSTGQARDYASVVTNAGAVCAKTIAIDYTGAELQARPLVLNSYYDAYNSPVVYLNDTLAFDAANFVHSDVTKLVDGMPNESFPAIKGGERMFFSDKIWSLSADDALTNRYRFPELHIRNGELQLQESLNMAGVRFVVTDEHGDLTGGNTSTVRFFDHGPVNDSNFSGYGRLLQLGSYNNTMNDAKPNWVTESGYINVFKQNPAPTEQGSVPGVVQMSMNVGNQFPASTNPSDYDTQRALHLILTSVMDKGGTNVAAGWMDINGDSSGSSFPYQTTNYKNPLLEEQPSTDPASQFSVDALKIPAAAIKLEQGTLGFSGFDKDGNAAKTPISERDAQGVVFVNHGGEISTNEATVLLDAMVVQRVWNDYNFAGDARVTELTGIIDLPHELSSFTKNGGIQAFNLTQEMMNARSDETGGYVRLSFNNTNLGRDIDNRSGANEVVINWFNRNENPQVDATPNRNLAALGAKVKRSKPSFRSPADASLDGPIAKPALLFYIGSDDDIRQLRVAGATITNPFMIEMSGDDVTRKFGRVREFASQPSEVDLNTGHRVSEGAHAVLFGVLGGRMGLGSSEWNDYSANPWNILGKEYVQIGVEGDCVVDVNSNLIVADNQALVAVDSFGQGQVQRVTFTSVDEREIRVPSGVELDLSSFGYGDNIQQIAFGGKVKLVVETGATIRGPRSPQGGVVLYFNDEAQLVFEAPSDRASGNKPYAGLDNDERCKLIGKFQIWLNKSAQISINDGVLVGVQSDTSTPVTDVTISLNRSSRFNIGDANTAGGAFEVGNPVSVDGGSIKFNLSSRHMDSTFQINRSGFLGLGAGVVEKQSNPNGSAESTNNPELDANGLAVLNNGVPVFNPADDAWQVVPRYNVDKVTIGFSAGTFAHNNLYDGSDANASLLAIGPCAAYDVKLGVPATALIKGGGNIMLVPSTLPADLTTEGILVNAWDYGTQFPDGTQYGVMASGLQIAQRADIDTRVPYNNSGWEYTGSTPEEFFSLLDMQNYPDEKTGYVAAGLALSSSAPMRIAYQTLDASNSKYPTTDELIVRSDITTIEGDSFVNSLVAGAAIGIETSAVGPTSFGSPA